VPNLSADLFLQFVIQLSNVTLAKISDVGNSHDADLHFNVMYSVQYTKCMKMTILVSPQKQHRVVLWYPQVNNSHSFSFIQRPTTTIHTCAKKLTSRIHTGGKVRQRSYKGRE
jgi:hypothetical protein